MKRLVSILLAAILILTLSITAFAAHTHSFSASTYTDNDSSDTMICSSCGASYFENGGLVDSGKHLDYEATTTYSDIVADAADIWNGYKSGVIREDGLFTLLDVTISDVNVDNGIYGSTYRSSGNITLNTYYLDAFTTAQKKHTILHELGHALGIGHIHISNTNIMSQGKLSVNSLSDVDKSSYDQAYSLY